MEIVFSFLNQEWHLSGFQLYLYIVELMDPISYLIKFSTLEGEKKERNNFLLTYLITDIQAMPDIHLDGWFPDW